MSDDMRAALEAKDRRIAELDDANVSLANLNEGLMKMLMNRDARIAELEDKLADEEYVSKDTNEMFHEVRDENIELRARIADFEALTKRLVNVVEFLNATHNSGDARDIIAEARAAYLGEKG
jgi:chromosome segregation ATPase